MATNICINEVFGFYLGAVCFFYGITLGLLALATWQNYTDVETRVGEEAAAVGVLYRDVSGFPDPHRTQHNHKRITMSPQRDRPLNDAECARMDAMLSRFRNAYAMNNREELDGFLAALICSPDIAKPSEYLLMALKNGRDHRTLWINHLYPWL